MNNSFQDCILLMRGAIRNYIGDNQKRDTESVSCFQLRSFVRGGHDAALAQSKLKLAKNLDFTLQTLSDNYENAIKPLGPQISSGNLRPDQSARLAYDELMTGFARLQDCIQAAKEAEKGLNGYSATGGKLADALKLCERCFGDYWARAKDQIWSMQELYGIKFEHNESLKQKVYEHFDKVLLISRGLFTPILNAPDETDIVSLNASIPSYQQPPAYANYQDMGAGADPFVEIKLSGGKTVTIRN